MLRKNFCIVFAALFLFLISTQPTFAQDYVLPYPGFMPSNGLYRVSSAIDVLEGWWSFGNLSQYKYSLKIADKKLVEAKTLFESKQYFFALAALQQSDNFFEKAKHLLAKAKQDGKDVYKKKTEFKQASEKHQEVLKTLLPTLPREFLWQPEFVTPTNLKIEEAIKSSLGKRKID